MSNAALHILNASAGSGKTYHLVKEYIKLLIDDKNSTSTFSSVIAMTFTNKAALEMKERIIAALYEISTDNNANNKIQLLIQTLSKEIDISHQMIVSRSRMVLESILHQYEDFNVMTIDKFNLRLIKSFGLELDLPGEFDVIIDETELIEVVVDDLLSKLGDKDQKNLSNLLLEYARANLDEGNAWNFRKNLIAFGAVLRNERNHLAIQQLMELNLSSDAFKELVKSRKQIENTFNVLVEKVRQKIDSLDPSSLPGGKTTMKGIQSISSHSEFPIEPVLIKPKLSENLEKSSEKGVISEDLKEAIVELNTFWENTIQEFASLHLFTKNFFNMALLQYMAKALENTKKEEQIVRISEFNRLISELIQDENAPFIYERLGSRFQHFLLDEFQDTSHLQWLNLVPLIHNSIGENLKNLIVGDPKQ
ncbi:UvrD-helicase domain-containing protein, partial [Crocinitomicaceae bacterium]|nr:UvrD-helicase domain-containing protein [Crocinitomicaceae bacterium]